MRHSVARALISSALACAAVGVAQASPIEYTLTVPYADVVLGGTSYAYSGYSTRFIFDGDDADVFTATVPLAFAAIYQGTARVQILDGSTVLTTAVFAPNQIVVSSDIRNGGLGFGFVPGGIGAGGFDVSLLQPVYPMSITNYGHGSFGYDTAYDLTLGFAAANAGLSYVAPSYWPSGVLPFAADGSADIFGAVLSCNAFSGFLYAPGCSAGATLQTDQGDFTIGPLIPAGLFVGDTRVPVVGEFTARALPSAVPEPPDAPLVALGLVLATATTARSRTAARKRRSR